MAIGRVFYVLLFAAHFFVLYGKSVQNTHGSNNISDTGGFLLMESHVSLAVGMDADGLKWTFIHDKMNRRHVGFGARNGVRLSHKGKPFTAFVLTLILISGDISTNPGPRCLCKLCKKRVKDRGIQCDVCSKWLHPDCIGRDEAEYIRLGESDETWLCLDCNEKDDLKKDFYSTLQAEINIRGLKVAHINCRGLLGKLTEITLILQETKIDILGITETHLSNKIKDEEIRIDGFNVQRLDRSNQQGRGF